MTAALMIALLVVMIIGLVMMIGWLRWDAGARREIREMERRIEEARRASR